MRPESQVADRPAKPGDSDRLVGLGVAAILIIALAIALLAHAYIGSFSRLVSDDYCTAAVIRDKGFWGAQQHWYATWSGRFSFTLVMSMVHLLGSQLIPFLPAVTIGFWVAALAWSISQLAHTASFPQPAVASLLLAELIIVSTLATTPAVYQSLYWATGAVTYVLPLLLLSLYIGLLCRSAGPGQGHRFGTFFFAAGLPFVAAGFSETYTALQVGGLSLAVLASAASKNTSRGKRLLPILIAGWCGTILGALILISAPGNQARIAVEITESPTPPPGDWISLIRLAVRFALKSIWVTLSQAWPTVAGMLVLPMLLSLTLHVPMVRERKFPLAQMAKWLWLGPLIGFTLMVLCFVPTAYVAAYVRGGYHPQLRLVVTSHFVFYGVACCVGILAGVILKEAMWRMGRHARPSLLWGVSLLVLLVPFSSVRSTWRLVPTVRQFASRWHEQEHQIRAAKLSGSRVLTITALPRTPRDERGKLYWRPDLYFGLDMIDADPKDWVNGCAAAYYGVDSIVAK
jgi:hypothetical protein